MIIWILSTGTLPGRRRWRLPRAWADAWAHGSSRPVPHYTGGVWEFSTSWLPGALLGMRRFGTRGDASRKAPGGCQQPLARKIYHPSCAVRNRAERPTDMAVGTLPIGRRLRRDRAVARLPGCVRMERPAGTFPAGRCHLSRLDKLLPDRLRPLRQRSPERFAINRSSLIGIIFRNHRVRNGDARRLGALTPQIHPFAISPIVAAK